MKSAPSIFMTMMLLACGASEQAIDGQADDIPSDILYAADTGGILEATPEAAGILKVANTLSRSELQLKVGLTSTTANNIGYYRLGDDGVAGTADDQTYDTLRELDDVPYVNAAAFTKLLAYARSLGYVIGAGATDPFDPSYCSGTSMTFGQARSRFVPGEPTASLGTYRLEARQRLCQDATGCSPTWSTASSVNLNSLSYNAYNDAIAVGERVGSSPVKISLPLSGTVNLVAVGWDLQLQFAGSPLSPSSSGYSSSKPADTTSLSYRIPTIWNYSYSDGSWITTMLGSDLPTGVNRLSMLTPSTNPTFLIQRVTDTCLYSQATGRAYRRLSDGKLDGSGVYTEYRLVLYSTYPASR